MPSCSAISLFCRPVRRQQDDACALRQPHTGELGARQLGQLGSLLVAQHNLGGNSHSFAPRFIAIKALVRPDSYTFHQEQNTTLEIISIENETMADNGETSG
jgi:hypothetical protein